MLQERAKQGDTLAMYNLGVILTLAEGPARDVKAGIYWHEQAVAQGVALSRAALVVLYRDGLRDLPADAQKAEYWRTLQDQSR